MRRDLEDRAQALGFDLFGVAPACEFPHLPAWAVSVIVLGMPALDPAFDLELYIDEAGEQRWSKWAYERLSAGAARLALALVEAGHRAIPLTYEDSLSLLDLKVAAGRAGLGVRGPNNLVITRRFGPRVRFGAVLTALPLLPDTPLNDYYCVCCTRCITACPTAALSPAGFDRARCIAEFAPGPEIAAWQRQIDPRPTPHTRRQCTACIDACPIGKKLPTRFWLY
ncbi:MAG: epoxyqueuosine reductase [Anaerolineae bacterium]|nr:epoxyqueuosine reductase [Anaerolineae bacterium]